MSVAKAVDSLANGFRSDPDLIPCVVGPTASGKTELAIQLCEHLGGEIISCDSVQIYRYFDIGSAKPNQDELGRAPHHLISILDPHLGIDAMGFSSLAEEALSDIRRRGKVPILCGGTFFWTRALIHGLAQAPSADADLRARHKAIVEQEGAESLHALLCRVDKAMGAKLHPNDVQRVSRALEVYELTGKTLSELQDGHRFAVKKRRTALVTPQVSPEELEMRIARRARLMLANGWVDEVKDLLRRGYGNARAMSSVGYSEIRDMLEGTLPECELESRITIKTRQFARKQRNWLRNEELTLA